MNKQMRRMLGVLIPIMVMVMACLPSGGEEETPPPPPINIIFQDDFSNESSGWEVGDYDTGSVGYQNGVYFVTSTEENMAMWGVANRSFDNVSIEVDAIQVSAGATNDNGYGIVCREQGDGNGYYFRVSGDGYYSIVKAEGDDFTSLLDDDWQESDVIHQGKATNHIRAVCDGSTLTLFVNGQKLATANDATFTSGDIALTATTYEADATEVHFDNLVVHEPR